MTNLAALAGERHIPQAWLQSYGFAEHPGGILIKHFDSDGSRARSSLRKNVSTSHPTWWPPEERHLAFVPFGAHRVTKARARTTYAKGGTGSGKLVRADGAVIAVLQHVPAIRCAWSF